jgi:hypothetical protein
MGVDRESGVPVNGSGGVIAAALPLVALLASCSGGSSHKSLCDAANRVRAGNEQLTQVFTAALEPIANSLDPTETQRLIDTNIPEFAATVQQGMPKFVAAMDQLGQADTTIQRDAEAMEVFTRGFATKVAQVRDAQQLTTALTYRSSDAAAAARSGLVHINTVVRPRCGFDVVKAPGDDGPGVPSSS